MHARVDKNVVNAKKRVTQCNKKKLFFTFAATYGWVRINIRNVLLSHAENVFARAHIILENVPAQRRRRGMQKSKIGNLFYSNLHLSFAHKVTLLLARVCVCV